ncbi:MAG: hypothetical protein HXX81_04405 [Campylobacterales bacterium]|nr:hypothetical protein [Campylobacterales bacterium]
MYKKDLDLIIKNGFKHKSFLLYGESDYFIDFYSKKISSKISHEAQKIIYSYDEYDFKNIKELLSQPSLFGDINIAIVKTDKKIAKKELDSIIESCYKNENSYFLYELYSNDQKMAKDISTSFTTSKSSDFVRFFKPTYMEMVSILTEISKEHKIDINESVIKHLLNIQNFDLSLCINELNKFKIFDEEISIKLVDKLVYSLGSVGIDDVIKLFFEKKEIKPLLFSLLEEGEDEIRIVTYLANFTQMLILFRMYIKLYNMVDSAQILGYKLPQNIENERKTIATKYSEQSMLNLLSNLLDLELTLKSVTDIDKSTILISSLIKFQAFL